MRTRTRAQTPLFSLKITVDASKDAIELPVYNGDVPAQVPPVPSGVRSLVLKIPPIGSLQGKVPRHAACAEGRRVGRSLECGWSAQVAIAFGQKHGVGEQARQQALLPSPAGSSQFPGTRSSVSQVAGALNWVFTPS